MSTGFYRAAFGSMLITLFSRCALCPRVQIMADRCSSGILSCPIVFRLPLPRLAGVTAILCLLLGRSGAPAKTP